MGKTRRHSPEADYEVVQHRERGRRQRRFISKKEAAKIALRLPVVQIPIELPRSTIQDWMPPPADSARLEYLRDYRLGLLQELGEQMLLCAQET